MRVREETSTLKKFRDCASRARRLTRRWASVGVVAQVLFGMTHITIMSVLILTPPAPLPSGQGRMDASDVVRSQR